MALQSRLDSAFLRYHRAEYIETDPIRYPHRFSDPRDIEVAAFYSAMLAYGNVRAIFGTLDALFRSLGPRPAEWLTEARPSEIQSAMSPLYHRFTTAGHLIRLTHALQSVYRSNGSLHALFLLGDDAADETIETPATRMMIVLKRRPVARRGGPPTGMEHLLASPDRGSPCKRLNLFLRWMVRKDRVDFGLWPDVSPARLVIPLDVHILRLTREWGLLTRKSNDWKAALELTARLRVFCPGDPVKFDFALTRFGMGLE